MGMAIHMADKTVGFKVSEDQQDNAQKMVEVSGLTNKDWFQKAVAEDLMPHFGSVYILDMVVFVVINRFLSYLSLYLLFI